jgi:hypothetical protein
MPRVYLSDGHKALLEELYRGMGLTLDELPYTEEFEVLYTTFVARSGLVLTRHGFWRAMANLRKASRLVRKKR